MLPLPQGVELTSDPSVADWIVERLRPWGKDRVQVGSFLPEAFDAYARVLHPAHTRVGDRRRSVPWSTLTERSGRSIGPDTRFREISGVEPWDQVSYDVVPSDGNLPPELIRALALLLEGFTSTPDRCWFCIWEGFGGWWSRSHSSIRSPETSPDQIADERREAEEQDRLLEGTPRVRTEHRAYFLFHGPLTAADSLVGPWRQSPNLWWPDDRAWCVASEIDGYSTYVGAGLECIERIVASPDLETIEVTPDSRMDPGPY